MTDADHGVRSVEGSTTLPGPGRSGESKRE